MEAARVDLWLWAVRAASTRSGSAALCRGGHVKVNGAGAKPATTVHPGDIVTARIGDRLRLLEVVRAIDKRVGAPIAAECVVDRSEPPARSAAPQPVLREGGAGRPTKKDRRQTDRLRRR